MIYTKAWIKERTKIEKSLVYALRKQECSIYSLIQDKRAFLSKNALACYTLENLLTELLEKSY